MREFLEVFGMTPEMVSPARVAYVAAGHGYAVMPVAPLSKKPVCPLPARTKATADKAARAEGMARHACGLDHASTDPRAVQRMFKAAGAMYPDAQLNLAIELGGSRILSVDCDSATEVEAFVADYKAATGLPISPTVETPGQQDAEGNWRHRDGGHFHFDLPAGVELRPGSITDSTGYVIKWHRAYVLMPPSVRPEGRYLAYTNLVEAPAFLLERAAHVGQSRAERADEYVRTALSDPIAAWSLKQRSDFLLQYGWTDPGRDDICGCPTYTRPGDDWGNPKSATVHEPGCSAGVYEAHEGHLPVHFWSDNIPAELLEMCVQVSRRTLTKLEIVAAMEYAGDVGEAMEDLGLLPTFQISMGDVEDEDEADAEDDEDDVEDEPDREDAALRAVLAEFRIPLTDLNISTAQRAAHRSMFRTVGEQAAQRILSLDRDPLAGIIPAGDWWNETGDSVMPTILRWGDPERALLYRGRVNHIVGARSAGKTWLAIVATIEVLRAGGRVFYADMEDTWIEFRARCYTLGFDPQPYAVSGHFVYSGFFFTYRSDLQAAVSYLGSFDLVVIDVISRVLVRLGATSVDVANDEVIWLTDCLFEPVARLGSAVLVLDHPNKAGQRANTTLSDLRPAGGAAKSNVATGAMLGLLAVKPFSRKDPTGMAVVGILKDRLGHVGALGEEIATFSSQADLVELHDQPVVGLSMTLGAPPAERTEEETVKVAQGVLETRILTYLADNGPSTASDMEADWDGIPGCSQSQISRGLQRLLKRGEIREAGTRSGATKPSLVYELVTAP